jgi:hypothetical protein
MPRGGGASSKHDRSGEARLLPIRALRGYRIAGPSRVMTSDCVVRLLSSA